MALTNKYVFALHHLREKVHLPKLRERQRLVEKGGPCLAATPNVPRFQSTVEVNSDWSRCTLGSESEGRSPTEYRSVLENNHYFIRYSLTIRYVSLHGFDLTST